MSLQNQIIDILSQVLQLKPEVALKLNLHAPLLGAIPEFDSMAVVSIITALEERFGFIVEDDEIDARSLKQLALCSLCRTKNGIAR